MAAAGASSSSVHIPAVVLTAAGHPTDGFAVGEVAKPTPGPKQVLVKVHAVGLNPVDFKIAQYNFFKYQFPRVIGCDFSGVVEEVGSEVSDFKAGDEVFGFPGFSTGTFAQYVAADADLVAKAPAGWTHEQRAAVPVSAEIPALALFYHLGLALPSKHASDGRFVLIWGGASAAGMDGIQLAAAAGYTVVTTASAANFDLVRSLGAAHVVDYNSPTAVEDIIHFTGGNLTLAFDTIGSASADLCVKCLSGDKISGLVCIAGAPTTTPAGHIAVKGASLGQAPSIPAQREFVSNFFRNELPALIASGKYRTKPIHGLSGYQAIIDGLGLLANNKVRGKKVVVTL